MLIWFGSCIISNAICFKEYFQDGLTPGFLFKKKCNYFVVGEDQYVIDNANFKF